MAAKAAAKLTLLHITREVMGEMYTTNAFLEGRDLTVLQLYHLASIFLSGKDSEQFIKLPSCVCSVYGKFKVEKSKTCF